MLSSQEPPDEKPNEMEEQLILTDSKVTAPIPKEILVLPKQ